MSRLRDIRVLVVDDSAYNRRALAEILNSEPGVTVVAKACDGEEALELALSQRPDVITLDLEMPRMGGFAFLRILMTKRPTPVIVISSHAQAENVFRALELGALDFVAKPTKRISPEIKQIKEEVISKVKLARTLKRDTIQPLSVTDGLADVFPQRESLAPIPDHDPVFDMQIIALAASTGGPTALTRVLRDLPADINAGIVVVQHMPPKFTTTFAERLDRQCQIRAKEVVGAELLRKGVAYIAPGQANLEVVQTDLGLSVVAVPPDGTERYVPSADRLFNSVAAAVGKNAIGVVLTGMGNDGSRGAEQLSSMGADVVVEDESTAVIAGMPRATIATGIVPRIAPLHEIPAILKQFAKRRM